MVRIPDSVLKKMSKKELIDLISNLWSELEKTKTTAPNPNMKDPRPENSMAELDKRLEAMDRSNRIPRVFKQSKFICHSCNNQFIDETSVFIKDINDPVCFSCRRRA